ncbi:RHS repeat-associated core domain-containing protein [Flavobacterium sp. CS20]|nr:RHS repeat-associated core domain-containing protein [Flavobacterium sp. CS20]
MEINQAYHSNRSLKLNTTSSNNFAHGYAGDLQHVEVFYFHSDHLGSSNYVSNYDGDISQHAEYLPFGELLTDEHLNSHNTRYKYNGKGFDQETSNYYYGARYYNPKTSLWLSVDPLAHKFPNISPYAAFNNNPIYFVDPDDRENIPALIWVAKNMANKGIPFGVWYGGDGGWTYKAGKVPTETVCYESCWTSYMNGADASAMTTLKTGFSTKGGGFKGRSHETGGMNWFKAGDGTDRQFVSDISKGELGDITFMGEVGDMAGHAVLLASDITKGSIEVDGKTVETMSFYALSTSSDTDAGNYGGRSFTFQNVDGKWLLDGNGYEFRGFGQMKNVNATDEQKQEATKLIDDIKTGN